MAYILGRKKPTLLFPSVSGAVCSFDSQYAGLPLKSHTVDIDSVSGVSAINIGATGKNLLDKSLLLDQLGWNSFSIQLTPYTTFVLSNNITYAKTYELPLYVFHTGGNPSSSTIVYDTHPVIVTTLADGILKIQQRRISGTDSFQNYKNQLEVGSTPTAYEAYNGNTYSIQIGSSVNKGVYDARTGILEVTSPTIQTIQLPPCPIDTLEGVNNIWADTGDTTLQYIKLG